MATHDPIGLAIQDYIKSKKPADIVVTADLCDDDIIPVEVLFRTYDEMPTLEQKAMSMCCGKILDVGAGAGPHSIYLSELGHEIQAIDTSPGAVSYLNSMNIPARCVDVKDLQNETYDTLLLLMNGIGIAGTKEKLPDFLSHLKTLLNPGGQILCDSSDVAFLYEEEDGSYWMDLNAAYYGNFKFQLHYKKASTEVFEWLYIDYESLHQIASSVGFKCKRLEIDDHHFLAQLSLQ
jgi:SAM-dependent methyltransferase